MAGGVGMGAFLAAPRATASAAAGAGVVPPWHPGLLDIHHINTGRGNATFLHAPDGTSVLIDCGASNSSLERSAPHRPNASKTPGQWVAEYIRRIAPDVAQCGIDFMVASHVHPDHIGDPPPGSVPGPDGYVPTGLSMVDQIIPARTVIDRSYPDFETHPVINAPFSHNHIAWLDARVRRGDEVAAIDVGSDTQIAMRHGVAEAPFSIRTVAGNGYIWTGSGSNSRSALADAPESARLDENNLSIALVIRLGDFGYFNGADLHSDTFDGRQPWSDMETPVARVTGRVEVASANHHGYFDAVNRASDEMLDPQAYIIPSWHISHPGQLQMQRMLRAWPGEKTRDVFALDLLPQNGTLNRRFADQLRSRQGHVLVRVQPDGSNYEIFVFDSAIEGWPLVSRFGPYITRS